MIQRSALDSVASWSERPTVETRIMPLATLGKGRMGLAEKTQAFIHQTWLEYGPCVSGVRAANADVRVCLSDMGTELGIGDAKDVVSECLREVGQDDDVQDAGQLDQLPEAIVLLEGDEPVQASKMLLPNAMIMPGPQHIIDSVVGAGVESLPWWEDWQAAASVVCQWLKQVNHRRWLKLKVAEVGGDAGQRRQRLASLDKGCDSFAQWRWKTLGNVTRDLTRMESAVRAGMTRVPTAKALGGRCSRTATAFWQAARDETFWHRASQLKGLLQPMRSLASWVRGCDCHEQERMRGKKVLCDWQGCRAASLASRVQQAEDELGEVRGACMRCGHHEAATAATRMLATFKDKFAFLAQEP